jgi:hypothetical protein
MRHAAGEDDGGERVGQGTGEVEPREVDEDEIGGLAHLEAAELVGAAEQLGAAAGGEPQRRVGVERLRAAARARHEQRLAHLAEHVRGVVAGAAVDAEPHRHRAEISERRRAAAETHVDDGQGDPVPLDASSAISSGVK